MAEQRVKLFSSAFMAGAFAVSNFILVLLLMWTVSAEYAPEWKKYQRDYYRLFAERTEDPELKQKILATPLEVKQVWTPKLDITDRCMTCHIGVSNPKMTDVPQPLKVHPDFTQHNFQVMGCVVCHEGQGSGTTVHSAHIMHDLEERFGLYDAQHAGWERPILPVDYVQASCHKCHNVMDAPIPGADHLNNGWKVVQEKGCKTCHYIVDSGAKQAPELSQVGTKFYNLEGHSEAFFDRRFGYLKESLRCPQANASEAEAEACQAELPDASAAPAEASLSGDEIVQKYQCKNCHSFDSPNKLLGPSLADLGSRKDAAYIKESVLEPDKVVVEGFPKGIMQATLSGLGFFKDAQANPGMVANLVTYLTSLKGSGAAGKSDQPEAAAALVMPNFNLSDDELRDVVIFLLGLQEQRVAWPQHTFVKADAATGTAAAAGMKFAGKSGEEVFGAAGCVVCHKLDGPDRLVGPSLWDIGTRKDKEYIRESILQPDKVVVDGFPQGVMKATLDGQEFYQNISIDALDKLVEYLATRQGKS